MKKIYPFIPILGILLVLIYPPSKTGIKNKYIRELSQWVQAISIVVLLLCLTANPKWHNS